MEMQKADSPPSEDDKAPGSDSPFEFDMLMNGGVDGKNRNAFNTGVAPSDFDVTRLRGSLVPQVTATTTTPYKRLSRTVRCPSPTGYATLTQCSRQLRKKLLKSRSDPGETQLSTKRLLHQKSTSQSRFSSMSQNIHRTDPSRVALLKEVNIHRL